MAAAHLHLCLTVSVLLLVSGVSSRQVVSDVTTCALLCLGCNELHKGTVQWEQRGGGEVCVNFCTTRLPSLVPSDFCAYVLARK